MPGTQVPPPMLAVASPPAAPPPAMPPPSRETVIQSMGVFGEAETIAQYPDQIEAMVAAASDEVGLAARLAELRGVISPTGWQPAVALDADELRRLAVPTLMIWGERDPLGGAAVARSMAATIPDARLELLPAGHGPWLGHPERTAELVEAFVADGTTDKEEPRDRSGTEGVIQTNGYSGGDRRRAGSAGSGPWFVAGRDVGL